MNLCLLTEKCHFISYFRIATGTWIASSKLNLLCYIQADGENCRFFFRSKCVSWGFSYWLIVVSFLWFNNENPDIYFSSLSHKSLHKEIQVFLPAATKLWPRLCFYTCLWFCPRGGSLGRPPLRPGRPPRDQADPPDWADTPPDQADPPGTRQTPQTRQTPPRPDRPPRDQADPPRPGRHTPWTRQTPPGSRLQHTVNERPVRILLECILVQLNVDQQWSLISLKLLR